MKTFYLAILSILSISFCNGQCPGVLVAYYPFNGNANDASRFGNNGTVYGATLTTDRFGNANSAYYFSGSDNYIVCGDSNSLQLPDIMSITARFNFNDGGTYNPRIISYESNDSTEHGYYILTDSSAASRKIECGFGSGKLTTSKSYPSNQWHFIAFISSDSIYIYIYIVDGVLDTAAASNETDFNYPSSCNLNIGRKNSPNYNSFAGKIDDIRIYSCTALTPAWIDSLYHEGGWTGINEETSSNRISIYPNPSAGKFIISLNNYMENASIKIFNLLGQEIYNERLSDSTISKTISLNVPAGIYFARLSNREKQYTEKLIIQ